jgi:hypothetical protein
VNDLYQIETRYASGDIIVCNGVVVKAAPIFRHLEGRLMPNVENWVRSNHAKIEKLAPPEQPTE